MTSYMANCATPIIYVWHFKRIPRVEQVYYTCIPTHTSTQYIGYTPVLYPHLYLYTIYMINQSCIPTCTSTQCIGYTSHISPPVPLHNV